MTKRAGLFSFLASCLVTVPAIISATRQPDKLGKCNQNLGSGVPEWLRPDRTLDENEGTTSSSLMIALPQQGNDVPHAFSNAAEQTKAADQKRSPGAINRAWTENDFDAHVDSEVVLQKQAEFKLFETDASNNLVKMSKADGSNEIGYTTSLPQCEGVALNDHICYKLAMKLHQHARSKCLMLEPRNKPKRPFCKIELPKDIWNMTKVEKTESMTNDEVHAYISGSDLNNKIEGIKDVFNAEYEKKGDWHYFTYQTTSCKCISCTMFLRLHEAYFAADKLKKLYSRFDFQEPAVDTCGGFTIWSDEITHEGLTQFSQA